jgi:hypothetical protein
MRHGGLSSLFDGVAVKRLAAVDASPTTSNQHEITGSGALIRILGDRDHRQIRGGRDSRFDAVYVWLGEEGESLTEDGRLSWYDSRRNKPRRAEWRLYYQDNAVTEMMSPGDSLFLARRSDDRLMFIVTPPGSTSESQLLWLFGLSPQISLAFEPRILAPSDDTEIGFAARFILDELGIDAEEPDAARLDAALEPLGLSLPSAVDLSTLARRTTTGVDPRTDPDQTLLSWMQEEDRLFRRFERRLVAARLTDGFRDAEQSKADGFLGFSQGVQQLRRTRTDAALRSHLSALFQAHDLIFDNLASTGNGPAFLFPGQSAAGDPTFPASRLTGLEVSLTPSWLDERPVRGLERVSPWHVVTLEPGLSTSQTDDLRRRDRRLVLPRPLHPTLRIEQRAELMDVGDFLSLARCRQEA